MTSIFVLDDKFLPIYFITPSFIKISAVYISPLLTSRIFFGDKISSLELNERQINKEKLKIKFFIA